MFFVCNFLLSCGAVLGNSKMEVVNFDGVGTLSFRKIAEQLSHKTKYTLLIDKSILDEKITVGKYGNIPVDKFLSRIMKNKNHSILYDNEKNRIVISTFISKKDDLYELKSSAGTFQEKIDPLSRENYAVVNASLKKAQNNILQRINDPSQIDPISMQSYYEINNALDRSKDINNQKYLIDPISGESFDQINVSLQRAANKYSETDLVDQISGQQYITINKSIEQSMEASGKKHFDPESIDPISGKSYRDINELIMKQRKKYHY